MQHEPGTLTLAAFTVAPAQVKASGSITGTTTVNGETLRLYEEGNLGNNPAAWWPFTFFGAGPIALSRAQKTK